MTTKSLLICTAALVISCRATASPDDTSLWADVFNKRESGGYLMLGISAGYGGSLYRDHQTSISLQPRGAYYFSTGLFAEYPGRLDQFDAKFTLGYNLFNTERWEFDAIISTAHGKIRYLTADESIEKQGAGYLGIRAAGDIGGLRMQVILAPLIKNREFEHGHYASLWIGKSWQLKNWHFYSSVGAQYRNDAMLDYYYGVPDTAVAFDEYQAKGGVNLIYKAGFSRPVTEHWLVEGYIAYTDYTSAILDSPYINAILVNQPDRKAYGSDLGFSLSYVF